MAKTLAANVRAAMLEVGNEATRLLQVDELTNRVMPKGTWQISFMLEGSTLTFRAHLDHAAFIQAFMGGAIDPPLWIAIMSLFAGTALEMHGEKIPAKAQIAFTVNGGDAGAEDYRASCTVEKLKELVEQSRGKTIDEISILMMTEMDLDRTAA